MFVCKSEISDPRMHLDLTGPDGNAFVLMSVAKKLGKQLGKGDIEVNSIIDLMKAGDYEHLLQVFDDNFGDHVIMYRGEGESLYGYDLEDEDEGENES